MQDDKTAALDAHVASLKRQLENAERMRALLKESPELAALLVGASRAETAAAERNGAARKKEGKPPKTSGGPKAREHFGRIASWFLEKGNVPCGTAAIEAGTGLTRSAVVQVLYRTHEALFEKSAMPGNKLKQEWRLKPGVTPEKITELSK